MAFVAILGMFYWMYKARKGELNLSTKSWHYKLKHWMWDFETYEGKNACPYYWGLVFSILFLPIYLIVGGVGKIVLYFYNLLLKFQKSKIIPSIKLPTIIPATKKEMYRKVYTNSETWLANGLLGIMFILGGIGLINMLINLFTINWVSGLILIGFCTIISVHIVCLATDNYFFYKNYWKRVVKISEGFLGLFQLPFILIYSLLKIPFEFIFKVYVNHCPPIKWED